MKLACILTGSPRTFDTSLKPFLLDLQTKVDLDYYVYFPNEQSDSYYNPKNPLSIQGLKTLKMFLIDDLLPEIPQTYTQKQKNSYIQWYRLEKCYRFIEESSIIYDAVLRIRPDIKLELDVPTFIQLLDSLDMTQLNIPLGFDIYDSRIFKTIGIYESINDQIAIGCMEKMKLYCQLFKHISSFSNIPPISEILLYRYLQKENIPVHRFALPYKFYLSHCKVIALSGDSGAGKTTILNAIQEIFPFDSSLAIETDRYHKWERNAPEWKSYTHLHPEANYLEKMSEDVFRLKLGENITTLDYNHSTGKFVQNVHLEAKPFILLCGLHTLYEGKLRDTLDLKIFVDTQEELRVKWKVERDMEERGHSLEKILQSLEHRKADSSLYILPQKSFADIILQYVQYKEKILLKVLIKPQWSTIIHCYFIYFSKKSYFDNQSQFVVYEIEDINVNTIIQENISLQTKMSEIPNVRFKESFLGVIQVLVYLLLFDDKESGERII